MECHRQKACENKEKTLPNCHLLVCVKNTALDLYHNASQSLVVGQKCCHAVSVATKWEGCPKKQQWSRKLGSNVFLNCASYVQGAQACAACVQLWDNSGSKVLAGTAARSLAPGACEARSEAMFLKLCYTLVTWLQFCICTVWCILSVSPLFFFILLPHRKRRFSNIKWKQCHSSGKNNKSTAMVWRLLYI